MKDLCIIFHIHDDSDATRYNLNSVRHYLPDNSIVAVVSYHPVPLSELTFPIVDQNDSGLQVWHADKIIWEYILHPEKVEARRYLYLESDTCCKGSIRKFYEQVWDCHLAVPKVITQQEFPDWWWWLYQREGLFDELTWGIRPICGVLMSRQAAISMAAISRNPKYDRLFSECRMAVLARVAGFDPVEIPKGAYYLRCCDHGDPHVEGAIWHPIKTIET